ncbi:MAG: hypothetical protein GW795_03675 [Cyanobacteria bacterium]|nr:hypothetical protein [Cyanobacteria bacterium CG_2015-16_32_12]NCO77213.1 hypothetical protein [Cyanobacteria bacterium CG_2015-22_32_23]NCQ05745.1 hypothetical protein [Cyanobacteria bacterium CG_2015-09_32_10]NCQ40996.1 hypothetical protein [Cyanobacteria bacterium CG_2015-04_32_10]NCS84779.1 hypothetical protein [Cyanobacteria bacterium CG_2015-02_32_10]
MTHHKCDRHKNNLKQLLFIGAKINLKNDYYCVNRVIFDVNENITAIVKDCFKMGKEEFIYRNYDGK